MVRPRRHLGALPAFCAALAAARASAAGPDQVPAVSRTDTTYVAPQPLGEVRVAYAAAGAGGDASLRVECGLFKVTVPARAIAGLPDPQWNRLTATYALTSVDGRSGEQVGRPSVELRLPLYGRLRVPIGYESRTEALFAFDAEGKLTRWLFRLARDPAGKASFHTVPWPLDSAESADTLLGPLRWPASSTTRPAG